MLKDPKPTDLKRSTPPAEIGDQPDIYQYEPSGIWERSGYIPIWLKLVAFGLFVWGVYYAMRYWNSY
jgi:hypothetical protein